MPVCGCAGAGAAVANFANVFGAQGLAQAGGGITPQPLAGGGTVAAGGPVAAAANLGRLGQATGMQGCVGCGCPNCRCAAMGGQNAQAQALAGGPAAQSAGTPVTAGGPASPAAAANSAKAAPGTATANAAGTGTANAVAAGGPAGGAPLTTADLITQIKTLLDGLQKLIGQLGGIQAPAAAAVPAKV